MTKESEQDVFDDNISYFHVGTEDEFCCSESVQDSDLSESDYDDDGSSWTDDDVSDDRSVRVSLSGDSYWDWS